MPYTIHLVLDERGEVTKSRIQCTGPKGITETIFVVEEPFWHDATWNLATLLSAYEDHVKVRKANSGPRK